jgi:transposase-like protein
VRGKRGRGAGSKTIVFGLFKRGGQVYTELVPACSEKTLQGIIRGKIDSAAVVNTDGWRGYDGLVDVGFDRRYRVHRSHAEFVQGVAHLTGIESFWSFAKSSLHQFAGVSNHTRLLHLQACEFRFNHRYQNLYKVLLK